jgi:hypothetical protein
MHDRDIENAKEEAETAKENAASANSKNQEPVTAK